jgi:hypothetical protein
MSLSFLFNYITSGYFVNTYGMANIPKDGGLKEKTANKIAIKTIGNKQINILGLSLEFLSKILCVKSVIITER